MQKITYKYITNIKGYKYIRIKKIESNYLIYVHAEEQEEFLLNNENFQLFIEDYKKNIFKKIVDIYNFEDLSLFLKNKKINTDIKIYYKLDESSFERSRRYKFDFAKYKIYLGDYILEFVEEPKYKSPINFSYSQLVKKFNNICFSSYDKNILLLNDYQVVNLNIEK